MKKTEKLKTIYRLLFDLATGKRPVVDDGMSNTDIYDNIHLDLYALGERLRNLALTSGMVPPFAAFEHVSSYLFVLDTNYRLIDFNAMVSERLDYKAKAIRYCFFDTLLTGNSALEWHRLMTSESDSARSFVRADLVFLAENGTQLPLYCTILNTLFEDWVFVVSVEIKLASAPKVCALAEKFTDDAVVVEQLHTYILEHLDEALPTLRALALRLGTEEHKLRQGFKAHYGRSIYQFYQEERLKRGHHLVLHTCLQLKEIAYQCGFSSYINFYKAFKKKFGMAPSTLLRPK